MEDIAAGNSSPYAPYYLHVKRYVIPMYPEVHETRKKNNFDIGIREPEAPSKLLEDHQW